MPVEMIAADGKKRKIQAAHVENLFRIISFKELDRPSDNLRDHMTDLELIFTMLGEASTTEIARKKNTKGFPENKKAAKEGGTIAGNARKALEKKSGEKVSTKENYKILPEKKVKQIKKNGN